ncbi:MAG: hypothetical protein ACRC02_01175 [Vogesella sp.]|uniref:hypothetical protein n=1 Tax=Vogesella sp. TaxID=1904252 RepID=UPI003F3BCA76
MLVAKQFSDLINFTRAAAAQCVDENGQVVSVPAGQIRLDHDLVSKAFRGVLFAEADKETALMTSQSLSAIAEDGYWLIECDAMHASVCGSPALWGKGKLVMSIAGGRQRVIGAQGVLLDRAWSMPADLPLWKGGEVRIASAVYSLGTITDAQAIALASGGFKVLDPIANAARWMFCSHSVVPNYRLNTATPETIAAQTYHVSSISFDRPLWEAESLRFAWQNAYTNNTGATPAELLPPTAITMRAAIFNGDAFVADITFGGQVEISIAAGDIAWCDPVPSSGLPVSGQLFMRTYSALPSGGQRPGRRQNTDNATGNGLTYVFATASQSSALALLTAGAVPNNSSYPNSYAFGPVCQVANRWDGRPVVLVVGDSIAAGNDNTIGASWITNALRSREGVAYGYYSLAIHGTKPSNQTGESAYGKKAAIVDTLVAMNSGALPMTSIISEMGVNDASGTNVAALQTKVQAWLDYIKSKWPAAKLIQTTYTPRTTSDAATLQTDAAVMGVNTVTPSNADRWGVADWIKTKPVPLDDFIDVRAAWTGSDTGTTWYVPPYVSTLAQPAAAGATSIVVTDLPPAGIVPVLSPGSGTTIESTNIPIGPVTGSGPYTVALGKALAKSHLAGATVKASPAIDGLHPEEGYMSQRAQAVVEAAKLTGVLQ